MENDKVDFWKLRELIQEFEKLDFELGQKYNQVEKLLPNPPPPEVKEESEEEKIARLQATNAWLEALLYRDNKEFLVKYYETLKAKTEIKSFLENHTHIKAGHDLARQLRNIRNNEGYYIDKAFLELMSKIDTNSSQEIAADYDYWGEFTVPEFMDENFKRRSRQVGVIVINKSIPDNFRYHLQKIKECYQLKLFEATVIYCRALIEAGAQMYLQKRTNIAYMGKEFKLTELLRDIKKYKPDKQMNDGAYVVKDIANNQLHAEKLTKIDEEKAFQAIKKTFAYIEYIFE
jgi:hypothetical protein